MNRTRKAGENRLQPTVLVDAVPELAILRRRQREEARPAGAEHAESEDVEHAGPDDVQAAEPVDAAA